MDIGELTRDFSGVVRVDRDDEVFAEAYGLAHRGYGIQNTVDTRFALASGSKGFTALAIISLIEQGALALSTTARSVLGADLPLIPDEVTVEQLLAHRSGIGDYFDEDVFTDISDYPLTVPLHELADVERYLPMLDGHPQKFPPGESFFYNNGGYAVLALIAQRVSGVPFQRLVLERVCAPAGMTDTDYLRSDTPQERTALGYLQVDGVWRTNVLHLPVRGGGDGGIYSTAADVRTFWQALFAGKIVPPGRVAEMVHPRSRAPEDPRRYGLGFWLHESSRVVRLEGYDAGVSFCSEYDPVTGSSWVVISNTSDGAWPIARYLGTNL